MVCTSIAFFALIAFLHFINFMHRANMDWDGFKAKQDAEKAKMFQKKHQKANGGGLSTGMKSKLSNGRSLAGNLVKLKMAGAGKGKGGKGGKGKGMPKGSTWNTEHTFLDQIEVGNLWINFI